jgi:hypothetical protein
VIDKTKRMFTHFQDLPNELFLEIFSSYFHGGELYKTFFGLNFRFDCLLKSLKNIYLRLEHSNDDQTFNLFSTKVISLFINSKHKSIHFIPLFVNIRSITLVDPTIIQIRNLLEIGKSVEYISIFWSNVHEIDLISVRAFYELIFCACSSENLRSCRFYLPKSHSLYIEPKCCSLILLTSLYVQITIPISDFRRILRLCPNLIRIEIEIVDNITDNEETIILLNHYEHFNIRRFHIYNLLSFQILDIYIQYLPKLENLFISMKFNSFSMDLFQQLSNLIDRIDYLNKFHFRFSIDSCNSDQQQLKTIQLINTFFQNLSIEKQDHQIIFIV